MNVQELFLGVVAALIVGNIVNKLIVNPLIYKLQIALFGSGQHGSKNISGSAHSESLIKAK